jgi:hypothetical protein
MISCEDWTRKSGLLTKIHELINFTLESKALSSIIESECNFAWSLLICFRTLIKDLIPIRVRFWWNLYKKIFTWKFSMYHKKKKEKRRSRNQDCQVIHIFNLVFAMSFIVNKFSDCICHVKHPSDTSYLILHVLVPRWIL